MLRARAEGFPLPSRAVLFCPGVDPTFESLAESDVEGADELLEKSRELIGSYLAGHSLEDPLVSPLTADLTGLPPLLIQAAEGDLALGDALTLETRMRESGVTVTLEPYFSMTHAFQMFWTFLPEAVEALASAGRFIRGG
jgi:acetyl esterase/lipase